MIRILLVDDQATVREGLKMRFALEPDLQVIGEAGNGLEALAAAHSLAPDVIVMDVEMPVMDGVTAAQQLQTALPHIGIVMLSIHGDAETRAWAQEAGAATFVEKEGAVENLLEAIRWLHRVLVGLKIQPGT
jgi:DNA-binding NarL/FixJ family response regulator